MAKTKEREREVKEGVKIENDEKKEMNGEVGEEGTKEVRESKRGDEWSGEEG